MHILRSNKFKLFTALFISGILLRFIIVAYQASEKLHIDHMPTGNLQFAIPKSRYLVGETVSYTIKNNYPTTVYLMKGCPEEPLSVYYWQAASWHIVHSYEPAINCQPGDGRLALPPGSTLQESYRNWPTLFQAPGKYRIALAVSQYSEVYYQDLEVTAAP